MQRPAGVDATAAHGGRPARRAMVRWAWRLFRREWRQQVLVLALLSLTVAATTLGAAIAANTLSQVDARMGTANQRLSLSGSASNVTAAVEAARQWFGTIEVIAHQNIVIPGSISTLDLRDADPAGVYGAPLLRVTVGHFPTTSDEVALTRGAAATLEVGIGDAWQHNGRQFRVVGLVENPRDLLDDFVLVAPGQAHPPDQVRILVDAPAAKVRSFHAGDVPVLIEARSDIGKTAAATVVLALGTVGLLFVGLVAIAGFTVMAQRRQRAMGMLGAIGATDRHIRLVMVSNGAVVGACAATTGALLGLGGWVAFLPHIETVTGHRIDRFDLPWWAVGASIALAIATAVAAAWWPARAAARVSIVAALSGRPPRPRPPHGFAVLGCVLLAGGLALLAFSHQDRAVLVVAGIVVTTFGMLLLAPLGIAGLARLAAPAPVAARLALRDLARHQARSGAAVAAITLAIGIAATIALSASSARSADLSTGGNLPDTQLVVHLGAGRQASPLPELPPDQLQSAQTAVDSLAAALLSQHVVPLDEAVNPAAPDIPRLGDIPTGKAPVALVRVSRESGGVSEEFAGVVYVATPAVLQRYGIDASKLDPAIDILTSRTDLDGLDLHYGVRLRMRPKVQVIYLPRYTSAPTTLLTQQAVDRLGLHTTPAGWLFETARPLTDAQINTARRAAAAVGLSVETRTSQRSLDQLRNWSTALGLAVAVSVLIMTVGLIRTETANDLRILAAAGADGTIRRNLTGWTAAALGLLGAVLGTAGAYLALVAWHRSELDLLGHPPLANLLVIVLGFPLVAAIGGWLLAGREPAGIARRPLE